MLRTREEILTVESILEKAGIRAQFEFIGGYVFFRYMEKDGQYHLINVSEFVYSPPENYTENILVCTT